MTSQLFYSDLSAEPRSAIPSLGQPHYSYVFPCHRIVGLFHGARSTRLPRPEIIGNPQARAALGIAPGARPPHLIFRPFDRIRVLKGAYNIAHVPWEFNHLIDTPPESNPHPFLSQSGMLRACEEVWTSSRHAAEVFRGHGVENVHVVPSPVACPDGLPQRGDRGALMHRFGDLPSVCLQVMFGVHIYDQVAVPLREQPALRDVDQRRIYLTVFNPGDFRKNAEKLLRGFALFAQDHPESILLVKLVMDNVKPTLANVQRDTLLPKFKESTTLHSPNVIFISPFLDDAAMSALYRLADHYICLSIGEGQNLPLCESMAQGVVPVSVAHTAMADYIDDSVACVVPSEPCRVLQPEASHYTLDGGYVGAFDCTESGYLGALQASLALSGDTLARMRAAAFRRARDLYSSEAVCQAIRLRSAFDFGGYL